MPAFVKLTFVCFFAMFGNVLGDDQLLGMARQVVRGGDDDVVVLVPVDDAIDHAVVSSLGFSDSSSRCQLRPESEGSSSRVPYSAPRLPKIRSVPPYETGEHLGPEVAPRAPLRLR